MGAPDLEPSRDADRSARLMSVLVAFSRASGLLRMFVAFAVLGTTSQLSNVYSSANLVPTLLFEMLAAGALSATLVPEFRRRHASHDMSGLSRIATSILVWGGLGLGLVLAVAVLVRHRLAAALLGGVHPGAQRRAAEDLLAVLLVFFLPQVLAYLANAVAVAFLHGSYRFGASVICPLVNNVVLIATYAAFALARSGRPPSVHLSGGELAILGVGTLGGVVAMCAVPLVDAIRHGFRPARPLPATSPELRRVVRDGGWAALFLAGGQAVTAAALPLANAHDGHAAVWLLGWQLFLLPHALLAVPVITARFPAMAEAFDARADDELAAVSGGGVLSVAATGALSGAILWAVAGPVATVLSVGAASSTRAVLAHTLAALGPGVAAYGLLQFLTRRCYAEGDTRTPALVSLGVAVLAIVAMYVGVPMVSTSNRLGVVALAIAAANLGGALVLGARVASGTLARPLGRRVVAALCSALAARGVVWAAADAQGRWPSLTVAVVAAVAGVAVYLVVDRAAGGPGWRRTLATMGSAEVAA